MFAILAATLSASGVLSPPSLFDNSFQSDSVQYQWHVNQDERDPLLSLEDIQAYLQSTEVAHELASELDPNQIEMQISEEHWGRKLLNLIDIIKLM